MGRLRYGMLVSLDGYARDASGSFAWAEPDGVLHAWVNEQERSIGTFVYGRGMWEVMRWWQAPPVEVEESPVHRDYAEQWRATDKVVVSRTLEEPAEPRTTLWRELDLDRLAQLVRDSPSDVSISGPTVAGHALRAGLVDEVTAYVMPHLAGGGLRWLPEGAEGMLRLREQRAFDSGAVALAYDVVRAASG
jgi:dihydrofolate reductase